MEKTTNKTNAEETNNGLTPPYLPVVQLEKLIKLVSNRNWPDISSSLFEKYEFSKVDALLAVKTFEFLGLVDKNGKPTNLMAKLRLQGDAKKQAFEEIVRKAYEKLFNVADKPYALDRDELFNEFTVNYELSRRVVTSAIPAFLKLCEYAGLKEETKVRKTDNGDKTKKAKRGKNSRQIGEETVAAGFFTVRVAEGRMLLNIPLELQNKIFESDDDKLHEDWRNLRTKLKEFADIYIPDNSSEKENPAENTGDV